MLTYVYGSMEDYIPRDLGLIVDMGHRCNTDLKVGDVQFARRDSAIWVAWMRVSQDEKYLFRDSIGFHERIGELCGCMKKIREWVLDMQKQLEHSFPIITYRFDIGIQGNWDIIETAIHAVWDDMDVIVCDG
jgi:hypothetical protein